MLKKKKLANKLKRKIFLKIKPNILYNSFWFSKFVNKFMQSGKKSMMENMVFRVFRKMKIEFRKNPLKILFFSLIKNRPVLWLAPVRIRRELKQVPFPVSPKRQLILSLTWFVIATKLIRYEGDKLKIEKVLYTQLKNVLRREKTTLTERRINHCKELVENRMHLNFRKKIKK